MNLLSSVGKSSTVLLIGAIALLVAPITADSGQAQVASRRSPSMTLANNQAIVDLAAHLERVGAKMYGAFWCPHCTRQKELFGAAFQKIEYVECDPRGENSRPNLCREAGVRGYPTWEINGRKLVGVQSLEELAEASNFRGSRRF